MFLTIYLVLYELLQQAMRFLQEVTLQVRFQFFDVSVC